MAALCAGALAALLVALARAERDRLPARSRARHRRARHAARHGHGRATAARELDRGLRPLLRAAAVRRDCSRPCCGSWRGRRSAPGRPSRSCSCSGFRRRCSPDPPADFPGAAAVRDGGARRGRRRDRDGSSGPARLSRSRGSCHGAPNVASLAIMIDLSGAPVIDTHLHGWRTPDLLDAPPAGFAERVTMLGMCVLTSGGDPATYADVLARATASTPLALALLARLGAHLGCEPTNEAVARRPPRAAARRPDRLPAGAVARRRHRGPGRRRGLSPPDHLGIRARARSRRRRPPRRADRAVDRRGSRRRRRL